MQLAMARVRRQNAHPSTDFHPRTRENFEDCGSSVFQIVDRREAASQLKPACKAENV